MGLKPRERRTVIIGGCLLFLMAALYFFYLSEDSLYNRWTELQDEVRARREVLARVVRNQVRYREFQQEIGRVTAGLAGADREDTLRGFLERLVKEQAPSARLVRMPSRDQTVANLYRQTLVTIDLENVTIPELVGIMSEMEASDQGIKVHGLKVTLSRRDEDRLDAIITALAAQPVN